MRKKETADGVENKEKRYRLPFVVISEGIDTEELVTWLFSAPKAEHERKHRNWTFKLNI